MSRIVRKSNFDLDWYDEIFVLGELPEDDANAACEELNRMWTGKSLGEEMDLPKLKQDLLIFKNKYKHSTEIQTDIDKVIKSVEAQNKLYVRWVTRIHG